MYVLLVSLFLGSFGFKVLRNGKAHLDRRCSRLESATERSDFGNGESCYVIPANPSRYTLRANDNRGLFFEIAESGELRALSEGGAEIPSNVSVLVYRSNDSTIRFLGLGAFAVVVVFLVFGCAKSRVEGFPDLPPEPAKPMDRTGTQYRAPIGPGIGSMPQGMTGPPVVPMQPGMGMGPPMSVGPYQGPPMGAMPYQGAPMGAAPYQGAVSMPTAQYPEVAPAVNPYQMYPPA